MSNFIIMRKPCLMEDEGRHFFERLFHTKKDAEDWIKAQEKEYFKPSDYYILEQGNNDALD